MGVDRQGLHFYLIPVAADRQACIAIRLAQQPELHYNARKEIAAARGPRLAGKSTREEEAMIHSISNGHNQRHQTPAGPIHPRLGIPELAGVCRYDEVGAPGFGVEENVALLKRYNWVETRLTDLFLTQLTSTPEWEV